MKPINLLYVVTKLELGGAQTQLLSLIQLLNKEKFHPFLFTARDGFLLPEALSMPGLTVYASRFLERPISPIKDLLALIELYRFIRSNHIAVVHTHSSKAGIVGRFAARLAGVKIIIHTVHGWSYNEFQPAWQRTLFVGLERVCAWFTDAIIVVSCHDRQRGLSKHIGREERYTLIHYGIEQGCVKVCSERDRIREALRVDAQAPLVGMVACLKPQKAPQDFIRLAQRVSSRIPQARFLLVGDGALRKRILRLIRKFNLGDKVVLTGWRRDIPRILSAIDVFVLTSLWEGLPVAVLEAMAVSLPVIVTDTGGVRDIVVDGKTGFIVAAHDIKGMAEKLEALLKNETLRSAMGKRAAKELDSRFSRFAMVRGNEMLYCDLLSRKHHLYVH